ncbi:MAG: hypothetical protein J2P58_09060, partial [Acidimicrobiaceae bacterium]|nr:hypothetical protein [Acidimicrobiaceae bacterium]
PAPAGSPRRAPAGVYDGPAMGRGTAWRRLAAILVCAGSALSLSACLPIVPFARATPRPNPTASVPGAAALANAAVDEWGRSAAEHFRGTFSASGIPISVDVNLAFGSSGDGLGSGTASNAPFQYLSSGQTPYLKGQSFWQTYYNGQPDQQQLARGYQENFTVASGNNVALAIGQLPNLAGAVAKLSSDLQDVHRGAVRTIDGRRAVALTQGDTTWWVTEREPVALVGLRTPVQGGLQNVDLTMQESRAPTDLAGQLGTPVDPNRLSTMPARYEVIRVQVQNQNNCTNTVCGFNVTVLNEAGAAAGQGVVTVSTFPNQASTKVLADCTAKIPTSLGNNQTAVVTCGVSGPGWQGYAGTEFAYNAKVTSNPPYL